MQSPSCPICQSPLEPGEPKVSCPECRTDYHPDCWAENKGCAVYGCPAVPPSEQLGELEIPVSYWGREQKPCPSCGREILAAAVRCRHCGAMFSSAEPETTREFRTKSQLQARLPRLRQTVVWLFILNAFTCSAPLAFLLGGGWYLAHRNEVKAMPSLYSALCRIALGIGLVQTGTMLVVAILYSLSRT